MFSRYHFAHKDGVNCMYQGFIKDINAVKRDFNISEIDDEGIVMIRAFQILRRLGQRIPKKTVEDMSRNCFSVFYEIPSKLIVLAGVSEYQSRYSIILLPLNAILFLIVLNFYLCCTGVSSQLSDILGH